MDACKHLAVVAAVGLMLGSLPAVALDAQSNAKGEQAASGPTTVKSSRPFRVRLGGFYFGAGYSRYSGYYPYYSHLYFPFYRPWYYEPFYSPFMYGGYYSSIMYHPGWYTGFARQPGMGEIRIRSNLKEADVYIDEALAGKIRDLRTLWLEPRAYNLKIQAENYTPFTLRIYVLSGKTLRVDANLAPLKEP